VVIDAVVTASVEASSSDVDRYLALALLAVAGARAALEVTVEYVKDRRAFGIPIATFDNTRVVIGGLVSELHAVETTVAAALHQSASGALDVRHAQIAKVLAAELYGRVADQGVQLHGGYGYMLEYPIAHHYADARYLRLHGGRTEQLRRSLGADLLDGARLT
jgi:alkylation response protein AidB-like acyl-CoA dehydrogenase